MPPDVYASVNAALRLMARESGLRADARLLELVPVSARS